MKQITKWLTGMSPLMGESDAESLGAQGNQARLNNGCVCQSGCEDCDRLAESWEAMREYLAYILDLAAENAKGQDGYEQLAEWSRKALALAARVKA